MFAAFVLAVPIFVVIIEMIGARGGDIRFDNLAREFTKLLSAAFATTASLGGLLAFALYGLYPGFMRYMTDVFHPFMFVYALCFFDIQRTERRRGVIKRFKYPVPYIGQIAYQLAKMIILILIALFSLIFLGFTGFKVIFGMLLVFFLPFYLILDNYDLSRGEKVIFSFFIGVGIFPAIAYWLGIFMPFRMAILITFVLLIITAYLIRRFRK